MKRTSGDKMTETIAETLSALRQEVKDFKDIMVRDITEIKIQTTKTNGSVNKANLDIQSVQKFQETCPARLNSLSHKEWKIYVINAISVIVTAVIVYRLTS